MNENEIPETKREIRNIGNGKEKPKSLICKRLLMSCV